MNPVKHIPNLITSLNLLAGCLSIAASLEGFSYGYYYILPSLFIFAAAVFDFLDGFFARLFKAYSELGKQLDSLADMVSFGVAPAFIMYNLIKQTLGIENLIPDINNDQGNITVLNLCLLVSPFLLVVFSGFRLAKFNIDTRQNNSFIGLPTPANAIFIASLPIIGFYNLLYLIFIADLKFLIPSILILCFLLVSPIPMFSLKFKNFGLKDNLIRYIFIVLVIVTIFFLKIVALPLVIILYIFLSIINAIVCRFFCKRNLKSEA